jgi:hypothetical protein
LGQVRRKGIKTSKNFFAGLDPQSLTEWDFIVRRSNAEELALGEQRLPLDELNLKLEAVLDALANDIAEAW